MTAGMLLVLGLALLAALGAIARAARRSDYVCSHCGTTGAVRTHTRGSLLIEIILWLCFIVPGVIYSLWRLTTRRRICAACGQDALVPSNSPRGRELVARFRT
jgi:5-methylcytosine-specific restriction endonuclease McrA